MRKGELKGWKAGVRRLGHTSTTVSYSSESLCTLKSKISGRAIRSALDPFCSTNSFSLNLPCLLHFRASSSNPKKEGKNIPCIPIRSTSPHPLLVTKAHFSPFLSKRAFVDTVVPIRIDSTRSRESGSPLGISRPSIFDSMRRILSYVSKYLISERLNSS